MTDYKTRWLFLLVLLICALPATAIYLIYFFPGLSLIGGGLFQKPSWFVVQTLLLIVLGGWGLFSLWFAGLRYVSAIPGSLALSRKLYIGINAGIVASAIGLTVGLFEQMPYTSNVLVLPPVIPAIYLLWRNRHSNQSLKPTPNSGAA